MGEGDGSSTDNLIESTVKERETDGWRVRVTGRQRLRVTGSLRLAGGWRVRDRAQTT